MRDGEAEAWELGDGITTANTMRKEGETSGCCCGSGNSMLWFRSARNVLPWYLAFVTGKE